MTVCKLHTNKYYVPIRKYEILTFAAKWKNIKGETKLEKQRQWISLIFARKETGGLMKQNKIKLEIKDLRLSEVQWMVGESEGGGV